MAVGVFLRGAREFLFFLCYGLRLVCLGVLPLLSLAVSLPGGLFSDLRESVAEGGCEDFE